MLVAHCEIHDKDYDASTQHACDACMAEMRAGLRAGPPDMPRSPIGKAAQIREAEAQSALQPEVIDPVTGDLLKDYTGIIDAEPETNEIESPIAFTNRHVNDMIDRAEDEGIPDGAREASRAQIASFISRTFEAMQVKWGRLADLRDTRLHADFAEHFETIVMEMRVGE